MRMNESLELDAYRAGKRQSPVFTRISTQTGCDFPQLKNENLRTEHDKTLCIYNTIEASSPIFTENLYPTFLPQ